MVPVAVSACGTDTTADPGATATTSTTAAADCTANAPTNQASPEFYRKQYDPQIDRLDQEITMYQAAVLADDTGQIGETAGELTSDVQGLATVANTQTGFGCYAPTVLASLKTTAKTLFSTLDNINAAATGCCGHTTGEVPGLIGQARTQLAAFVTAVNAYGDQFGGQQIAD